MERYGGTQWGGAVEFESGNDTVERVSGVEWSREKRVESREWVDSCCTAPLHSTIRVQFQQIELYTDRLVTRNFGQLQLEFTQSTIIYLSAKLQAKCKVSDYSTSEERTTTI